MHGVKTEKGPMTVTNLKYVIKRIEETGSLEYRHRIGMPEMSVAVVSEALLNRHRQHLVNPVHL